VPDGVVEAPYDPQVKWLTQTFPQRAEREIHDHTPVPVATFNKPSPYR
jgi:hypothetical protein